MICSSVSAILIAVLLCRVVVLLCVSVMTNDAEYLLMGLLAIYLYTFTGEMSGQTFCLFLYWIVWFFITELYNVLFLIGAFSPWPRLRNESLISASIAVSHSDRQSEK